MDDRVDAGLLFVLLDRAAQASVDDWDRRLRTLPGAAEVTWWDNAPGDFTASLRGEAAALEPFETLGIVELEGSVDPSIAPEDLRTILFRRYPRPSQGRLHPPTRGLLLAMISPQDLGDDNAALAIRNWADFVHIAHIIDANVPGYGLVTPYENTRRDERPRFLHLYEYTDEDAAAVFRRCRPCVVQRFGGQDGKAAFEYWKAPAMCRIDYVNVFNRIVREADPSLRLFPPVMPERPAAL